MRYVVIGDGPAGVVAAETLRKADPAGGIRLVGEEHSAPYSRMAIPYLLMGRIGEDGMHLRKSGGHFERHHIERIKGRAVAIDRAAGHVVLADGRKLDYDRMLLATGCRPIRPPIPGMDLPGVHSCWTIEDARAVMRLARPGARVVQMGAGFIGCIVMEALAARGVDLTVVEAGDRMVPRMMTQKAGGLIKRWCQARGVKVFTSAKVESIEPAGKGAALVVRLSGGESLRADLVISATGVRPCLDLAASAGLATGVGIRVDNGMRTSDPRIFAAGDAAQAEEFYTRNKVVNAVQPNAAEQARVAALNMAGGDAVSPGTFAMNVLDTLGLIAASFGQWQGVPGGEAVERVDEQAWRYVGLQFDGDRLIGATTLGFTENVGVLRGLIQSGRPIRAKAGIGTDPRDLVKAYIASVHAA